MTTAGVAHARDPAAAQALFDQGRKLMEQERWAEACPKLEESERLDPAGGTLLHLALCREHEGRIATAWAIYQDALAQAKRDARKDRAKVAQERVDALTPRLPHVRVRVAPANRRIEGFTITRDDVTVGEAQWGEALPVDPGSHALTARGSGRKPWTTRINVPATPDELVLDVPELEIQPADVPKGARPKEAAASDGQSTAGPSSLEAAKSGEGQRTIGIVIAGVGVAGLITGSIAGLVSFSKKNEADQACTPPDRSRCTAQGVAASDAGMRAGTISTIGFIAGGALAAGGAIIYFTAPSGSSVAIAPSATPHSAALALTGTF